MAKIEKPSDDVIQYVENIINRTTLTPSVNFRVLSAEKQKCLIKVSKASPTVEYLSGCKDLVVVYINEDIFYAMEEKDNLREMLIVDGINTVSYDFEKEKIMIKQPQLNITLDGYRLFGKELVDAQEIAYAAYKQQKELEKEDNGK